MATRKSYALDQCPLYKISSRKRLAHDIFNVELQVLERLATNRSNFRVFTISQGGKERQVEAPKAVLERFHRRIFNLLERIEKPEYLHSGVRGRSYISNAKIHVGTTPLVKLDLKKFYPSVEGARVYRFFTGTMRCSPDVAGLLTRLCTFESHVPTGSCVSQLLAFYASKPMFDELHVTAAESGVRFSCYVDDLTWSGHGATPAFLWKVKQVVHRHGFRHHKDRCFAAGDRKLVTGVILDGDRIAVQPSKEFDLWRNIQTLGGSEPERRLIAVNSLIGSATAAGQIEARFLRRLLRLRRIRDAAIAEMSST
nr:reverse transcriptase family protein [uncultured Roseateles sp.]